MKEIFYIDDTLNNKISYFLLLAFLAALPLDLFYSEMVLVCLLIHSLIHLDPVKPFRRPDKGLLLVVALYVLTMAGTLYSQDRHQAWKDWEKQLAFFLFPLIFSINSLDLKKYRFPLLKGFAFSCLIIVLYLYAEALRLIRFNGLSPRSLFSSPFMNHNFSLPIGLHATYFAMYIALSLVTFTWLVMRAGGSKAERLSYGLAVLILLAALLQLATRSVCVAVLIMLVTIPFFFLDRRSALRFVLVMLPLAVCFLLAMTKIGTFRERYFTGLKADVNLSAEEPGIVEPRAVRWACAWDLIKASPWIGYGTGAEVSLLKDAYFDRQLYSSYINELNAHNEYLSFLLKTGPVGLLLYLALLGTGFVRAIRTRDAFFYGFVLIVFCVSFSENILDTNKGIFFCGLFFSLFFMTSKTPSTRGPDL